MHIGMELSDQQLHPIGYMCTCSVLFCSETNKLTAPHLNRVSFQVTAVDMSVNAIKEKVNKHWVVNLAMSGKPDAHA